MDILCILFLCVAIIKATSLEPSSALENFLDQPACLPENGTAPVAPFVVGGNSTSPGEFPWLVVIHRLDSEELCAGSLIDLKTVLTAAHCLVYEGTNVTWDPNTVVVVAGDYNLSCQDPTEQVVYAKEIRIQVEDWDSRQGDIGLIKLSKRFTVTSAVQPIPLPVTPILESSGTGVVAGWGSTDPDGKNSSDVLLQATLPVVPCTIEKVTEYREFCAGGNGTDSCNGDSGGSLICRGKGLGTYLCGIVSHGQTAKCGELPGVYTNVSTYLPWIAKSRESHIPWIFIFGAGGALIVVILLMFWTFYRAFEGNRRNNPGPDDNGDTEPINTSNSSIDRVNYSSNESL